MWVTPKIHSGKNKNKFNKEFFSHYLGQNKNNLFLMYLLWRVMNGLNIYTEYSFITFGHTKFSCDHCFGNFKKKGKSHANAYLV